MKLALYVALVLSVFSLSSCTNSSTSADFDFLGQFKKDTAAIKSYLKKNNIQAVPLSQGVWLTVDAPSTGLHATYDDTVSLTYKMRLLSDNSIVDQSSSPLVTRLSNLIPGIQIAMPQYQKGSSGRIFIPSFWGYQNVPNGPVPANSNLIFEFTLGNVLDHQLKVDTTTIGNYLRDHQIAHLVDVSGLLYTINTAGSGIKPTLSDSVQVTYSAKIFPNGNTFSQHATAIKALVTDFPIGVCIGLTNLQEGSSATMYVPSSLAFGPKGLSNVPEDANVIYTINLVKVIHH